MGRLVAEERERKRLERRRRRGSGAGQDNGGFSTIEAEARSEAKGGNLKRIFSGWPFNRLFVGLSFGPSFGPSVGPSVSLKRSYVQTAQIALLWAQNSGPKNWPQVWPETLKVY